MTNPPTMAIVRSSESSATLKQVAIIDPALRADTPKEKDFEELLRRVRGRAMTHAEYFIGYDAAKDAVQKVMIEKYRQWDTMLPEDRTETWFLAAVHFRVVDELRRRRRYVELTDEIEERYDFPQVIGVSEATEAKDWKRWYDHMVAQMPLRRREVWKLVREQGFTYEAAAKALGISVPTVVTHLQKARDYFLEGMKRAGIVLTPGTLQRLLAARAGASND